MVLAGFWITWRVLLLRLWLVLALTAALSWAAREVLAITGRSSLLAGGRRMDRQPRSSAARRSRLPFQGAYLCTGNHNFRSPGFDLQLGPIRIDSDAWIAPKLCSPWNRGRCRRRCRSWLRCERFRACRGHCARQPSSNDWQALMP